MRIDVVSIFPEMFASPLSASIPKIAQERGILEVAVHDLRDYTTDRHRQVDDTPYGGGPGMVMKPEPFFGAVERLERGFGRADEVVLTSPRGRRLDQALLGELSLKKHLVILCGRYEGVDERVHEHLATMELSIGDYVLSGGELPAMVVIDGVARLLEGVLGDEASCVEESFSEGLLEYPHYTRPAEFRGWSVPEVLLSGNHAEIERWRREKAREMTVRFRPDLLAGEEADSK
ncbi:MAG: tRNA (guanosine(37)-N1)-methyltransferase TrmD [Actinobacteria bacterium]|nr:MAG: tRNA (guanosine(37)-N1)-methyltransferase TrmD [Actinomycetota bacterium]